MLGLYFIVCVLLINIGLVAIGKKFNILTIVIQLTGAMIIAPFVAISFPQLAIDSISNSDSVKVIYDICFVILIAYVLHDSIDCNYNKNNLKLVIPSFFIPFFSGIICSIVWLGSFQLQQAIVFGIIFSITAVPVLYMYLKGMNYSAESTKFFIQTAILIDVISWVAHSLVSEFHVSVIILCVISILLALLTKKINNKLSGVVLIIMLLITSYLKSNVLLVGVCYVVTSSYLKMPIHLLLTEKTITIINNYILVPILLFVGLSKVNWSNITPVFDIKLLLLILAPLLSKIIGNYIGLSLLKKSDKLNSSILLNTRGLTEIVFLNLVFGMKIIDSYTYVIFLVMSLICTLLPVFFCKKQNNQLY